MRVVVVDREDRCAGCWMMVTKKGYPKLDGKPIHQQYAAGSGVLVRHLCSNKHCINPMHLLRGSDGQNSLDEMMRTEFNNYIAYEMGYVDRVDYGLFFFARWLSAKDGTHWNVDCARSLLERKRLKTMKWVIATNWLELGEDVIIEQRGYAKALMSRLERDRSIVIMEV